MTSAMVVDSAVAQVCATIAGGDCAIVPDFLPTPIAAALAMEARRRDAAGDFRAARIGRGKDRIVRSDIRGDRTLWLDEQAPAPAEIALWHTLETLRVALNESTYLGLFAFDVNPFVADQHPPATGATGWRGCGRAGACFPAN